MSPWGKRLLGAVMAGGCTVWLLILIVVIGAAAWLPTAIAHTHDDDQQATGASAGKTLAAGGKVPAAYRGLIEKRGNSCPALTSPRLAALIQQESGWNPKARSPVGAAGIAQFMPGTWASAGIDANKDGHKDVWDPSDAIPSAATYLCGIAKQIKSVPGDQADNMLAAYNAGVGAVRKHHGVPPYQETQNYVRTIRHSEKALAADGSKGGAGSGPAVTGAAKRVLAAARSQIGKPYVWGGGNSHGPTAGGFDCSGLTQYALYQGTGGKVQLPRVSQDQRHVGKPVSKDRMKPGDLIVIDSDNDGTWGHVVLYAGGDRILEAPRTGKDVRETTLDYWKQFPWDVRRVL